MTKFLQKRRQRLDVVLASSSCCFDSGFGVGGLSVSGEKIQLWTKQRWSQTPVSFAKRWLTLRVAGAPLKKALVTLDQVETELQTAQLKEYREQVAICETFVE